MLVRVRPFRSLVLDWDGVLTVQKGAPFGIFAHEVVVESWINIDKGSFCHLAPGLVTHISNVLFGLLETVGTCEDLELCSLVMRAVESNFESDCVHDGLEITGVKIVHAGTPDFRCAHLL